MGGERLDIREDILKLVTSEEAEQATRYLSLFYLRLVRAPHSLWEGDNVIRLSAEIRDGQHVSAWAQFLALVKVSPTTARKAIAFLHRKGVIAFYTTEDKDEIVISFEGLSSRTSDR
jgi:hypothetical protein